LFLKAAPAFLYLIADYFASIPNATGQAEKNGRRHRRRGEDQRPKKYPLFIAGRNILW
jgi:hypothetical protein